jgi:hypothetical protein
MRVGNLPWLRDLYRTSDPAAWVPEVWVQKASQVFVSEWLLNNGLWVADSGLGGRGNALYVFPRQVQMNDFVHARVDTAIEDSAYLRERVGVVPGTGKPAVDNVGLKRLGRGHVYFRGSEQRPQIITIDADALLCDEVDEFAAGVVDVARERLGSARRPMVRGGSTPKYPSAGIASIFDTTTKQHYFIRCGSCSERQALEFPRNLTESGDLVCFKCGGSMQPDQEGEWVAERPSAGVAGYHVSRLYSPRADLVRLARLGYDIEKGLISNPSKVQEFFNQNLGLPHAPEGGSLTADVLAACERDFGHPWVTKEHPVTMGVDVGAVLHFWIEGPKPDAPEIARLMFAGTTTDWADLDRLMERFLVNQCVIDANPESAKAMAFAKRHQGRVLCCFYPNMKDWRHKDFWDTRRAENVVLAHRTRSLDETFDRFYQQRIELPRAAAHIRGLYDQLKAPVRILVTDQDGRTVARYDEGTAADHYAHAANYAHVARKNAGRRDWGKPLQYGLSSSKPKPVRPGLEPRGG